MGNSVLRNRLLGHGLGFILVVATVADAVGAMARFRDRYDFGDGSSACSLESPIL